MIFIFKSDLKEMFMLKKKKKILYLGKFSYGNNSENFLKCFLDFISFLCINMYVIKMYFCGFWVIFII